MILNNYILSDKSKEIEEMEDEFQLMYLASTIVDGTFNFFKIERKISNVGKPPFDLKDMIKLIFYGHIKENKMDLHSVISSIKSYPNLKKY